MPKSTVPPPRWGAEAAHQQMTPVIGAGYSHGRGRVNTIFCHQHVAFIPQQYARFGRPPTLPESVVRVSNATVLANNRACSQIEAAGEKRVERVFTVVLSNRKFDQVPPWLDRFPALRAVDLTFNKIPKVGDRLSKAGGTLQELRLGSNALDSTEGLSKLRDLRLLGLQCVADFLLKSVSSSPSNVKCGNATGTIRSLPSEASWRDSASFRCCSWILTDWSRLSMAFQRHSSSSMCLAIN